jgi:DNA-binding CsgD family transcriptional regulator/PAS domain-containing protein
MSPRLGEVHEVYIRDGWIHRDERYRAAPIFLRNNAAGDLDYMTSDAIRKHPYYQEFLAPFGMQWAALVKVAAGEDLWCLSIQRTIDDGPFSAAELKKLAAVSESLSSAAALAPALGFARAEAALAAFEVSNSAVVLLDRSAQVVRANEAAERLLRVDPRIERRRIVSNDHNATAALDRALHALLWNCVSSALMPPVALPRTDLRPVLAYPLRLAAVSADALAACQAVVVLVDLEQRTRPPEAALRNTFGLTPSEARLASRLATGQALEPVSEALAITRETARGQLKRIFDKTGVHRQPELVALLVSLLGQFVGGG